MKIYSYKECLEFKERCYKGFYGMCFGNFSEYTPLQVKQAVTGNGKATKEQVSFMVKRLLGIKKEIKPLDITDAIAIALTHSQRIKG